jgi:hypothetical protein
LSTSHYQTLLAQLANRKADPEILFGMQAGEQM